MIDLNLKKQLDIIMSWNRPDVAKKYILLQGTDIEVFELNDTILYLFYYIFYYLKERNIRRKNV